MIFMIIFTMEYIRLLGSSVDPILVAMTSYLMVPIRDIIFFELVINTFPAIPSMAMFADAMSKFYRRMRNINIKWVYTLADPWILQL